MGPLHFIFDDIYVCARAHALLSIHFIGLFTSATVRPYIFFFGYVIFINARVGSIHSRIFTDARVKNIITKLSKTKQTLSNLR
jgi:hypothetical protein